MTASGSAIGVTSRDYHSSLREEFGDSLKMEKMLLKFGQILTSKDVMLYYLLPFSIFYAHIFLQFIFLLQGLFHAFIYFEKVILENNFYYKNDLKILKQIVQETRISNYLFLFKKA